MSTLVLNGPLRPAQHQKKFMYLNSKCLFTSRIGNLSRTTSNWFREHEIENLLLKTIYFTSFLFYYFRCWKIHRARQRALWHPWGRICNWRSKGNSHRSQVSSTFKMKILNLRKYFDRLMVCNNKNCQLFFRDANCAVDWFLSHLGDPGRYQVIIMILMAANCIPVVVNHLLMAFYVPFKHTSNHNCRVGCLNVYIHTYMSFNNTPGSDVPTQFLIAP